MHHYTPPCTNDNITQDSVATRLRYDGIFNKPFMANLLLKMSGKNFKNRLAITRRIVCKEHAVKLAINQLTEADKKTDAFRLSISIKCKYH